MFQTLNSVSVLSWFRAKCVEKWGSVLIPSLTRQDPCCLSEQCLKSVMKRLLKIFKVCLISLERQSTKVLDSNIERGQKVSLDRRLLALGEEFLHKKHVQGNWKNRDSLCNEKETVLVRMFMCMRTHVHNRLLARCMHLQVERAGFTQEITTALCQVPVFPAIERPSSLMKLYNKFYLSLFLCRILQISNQKLPLNY